MEKFTQITAAAAPMELINIDTDMIIPKQYLKTIKRSGLGVHLFDEMRYLEDGSENPDFVLNQPQYRNAEILIAGDNFGCGSSREHAPWALLDFGIRCVIAPSFADIFHNNTSKNGILAIILPEETVNALMEQVKSGGHNARMSVDLNAQEIVTPTGEIIAFDIDPKKRHALLNGLDDIGATMQKKSTIDDFETRHTDWLTPSWNAA